MKTNYYPVKLTGEIQKLCFDIKLGKIDSIEFKKIFEEFSTNLDTAFSVTTLPKQNYKIINELLVRFYVEYFNI